MIIILTALTVETRQKSAHTAQHPPAHPLIFTTIKMPP